MSLTRRIRSFLGSPQGQRAVAQGRRQLANPANQHRLRSLLSRLTGRR